MLLKYHLGRLGPKERERRPAFLSLDVLFHPIFSLSCTPLPPLAHGDVNFFHCTEKGCRFPARPIQFFLGPAPPVGFAGLYSEAKWFCKTSGLPEFPDLESSSAPLGGAVVSHHLLSHGGSLIVAKTKQ